MSIAFLALCPIDIVRSYYDLIVQYGRVHSNYIRVFVRAAIV